MLKLYLSLVFAKDGSSGILGLILGKVGTIDDIDLFYFFPRGILGKEGYCNQYNQ